MTPATVGGWLLLLGGIVVSVAAARRILGRETPARAVPLLLAGLVAGGVGACGPRYLDPYARFLGVVKGLADSPGPTSYRKALKAIAEGGMPREYQELALAYMVGNPIGELDAILENATLDAEAPASSAALRRATEELRGRRLAAGKVAGAVASRALGPEEVARLDTGTRFLVAEPLLELKEEQLKALDLERARLRDFREPRSVFVPARASR